MSARDSSPFRRMNTPFRCRRARHPRRNASGPRRIDDNAYMLSGRKPGTPLSNVAFLMLLRRMGHADLTAHGFRATFKTWASERTSFQNEIVEAVLAQVIGD